MVPYISTSTPRRIDILRATESQNEFGETIRTWEMIAQRWTIDWKTLGGRELYLSQQTKDQSTATIILRYDPGLKLSAADRIHYQGNTFDITNVNDINERHAFWAVQVKESSSAD